MRLWEITNKVRHRLLQRAQLRRDVKCMTEDSTAAQTVRCRLVEVAMECHGLTVVFGCTAMDGNISRDV